MGLLTLHDEVNPGHGRRKIVRPLAKKYELVATIYALIPSRQNGMDEGLL